MRRPREWRQLELGLPLVRDATSTFHRRQHQTRRSQPVLPRDPVAMSDAELLTVLLGPTHREACERITAAHARVREIAGLWPAELHQHGLTAGAIEKLAAVFEVAKRYGQEEFVPGQALRGSYDVYAHFRERLAEEVVEFFYAVLLDNKHRKLKDVRISQGSLTSSVVHPREVYLPVIRESAAAVVFVHNHPSGDPTPSKEDIELTRRLRDVGDLVGVRVLDHVIVAKAGYVSFVDDGYW